MARTASPSGIHRAVIIAGTQQNLARRLGVTQQAISKWLNLGWVPTNRAFVIQSELKIPLRDLVNPRLRCLVRTTKGGA